MKPDSVFTRASEDPIDRSSVDAAVRRAGSSGRTQWIARVLETVPKDLLRCYAMCGPRDRFFWTRGESGDRFVAWGRVDEIESAGANRFADVEAWAMGVRSRLHWTDFECMHGAPLFVGGFGFEDDAPTASEWKSFPAARFILPATIGEFGVGRTRWTLIARVEPGVDAEAVEAELDRLYAEMEVLSGPESTCSADPNSVAEAAREGGGEAEEWPSGPEYRVRSDRAHPVFMAQVGNALEDIAAGRLAKVVVARSLHVDHDGVLDLSGFLARLESLYPSCTLVAMGRGDDTFLAATPETLVRMKGDRVETAALAGSAPRGRTPQEDTQLGNELRSSVKEQAEHAHVVDALRRVLTPLCAEFEAPAKPRLRRLLGIQHLETPISGRLRNADSRRASGEAETTILDLVAALHPTPAVGGVPWERAREWLRRHERLARGWYASPVGWLDVVGGGDFCVALRSALIRVDVGGSERAAASHAWLFAGAGIVAGSEPEAELVETRIKLRALLAPLTEI